MICPQSLIKARVRTAIAIESGDIVPRRAVDGGEFASDEHFAITLDGHANNRRATIANPQKRVKPSIQTAIAVEPGDVVAGRAIHAAESPPDEHLAIALHDHGINLTRS